MTKSRRVLMCEYANQRFPEDYKAIAAVIAEITPLKGHNNVKLNELCGRLSLLLQCHRPLARYIAQGFPALVGKLLQGCLVHGVTVQAKRLHLCAELVRAGLSSEVLGEAMQLHGDAFIHHIRHVYASDSNTNNTHINNNYEGNTNTRSTEGCAISLQNLCVDNTTSVDTNANAIHTIATNEQISETVHADVQGDVASIVCAAMSDTAVSAMLAHKLLLPGVWPHVSAGRCSGGADKQDRVDCVVGGVSYAHGPRDHTVWDGMRALIAQLCQSNVRLLCLDSQMTDAVPPSQSAWAEKALTQLFTLTSVAVAAVSTMAESNSTARAVDDDTVAQKSAHPEEKEEENTNNYRDSSSRSSRCSADEVNVLRDVVPSLVEVCTLYQSCLHQVRGSINSVSNIAASGSHVMFVSWSWPSFAALVRLVTVTLLQCRSDKDGRRHDVHFAESVQQLRESLQQLIGLHSRDTCMKMSNTHDTSHDNTGRHKGDDDCADAKNNNGAGEACCVTDAVEYRQILGQLTPTQAACQLAIYLAQEVCASPTQDEVTPGDAIDSNSGNGVSVPSEDAVCDPSLLSSPSFVSTFHLLELHSAFVELCRCQFDTAARLACLQSICHILRTDEGRSCGKGSVSLRPEKQPFAEWSCLVLHVVPRALSTLCNCACDVDEAVSSCALNMLASLIQPTLCSHTSSSSCSCLRSLQHAQQEVSMILASRLGAVSAMEEALTDYSNDVVLAALRLLRVLLNGSAEVHDSVVVSLSLAHVCDTLANLADEDCQNSEDERTINHTKNISNAGDTVGKGESCVSSDSDENVARRTGTTRAQHSRLLRCLMEIIVQLDESEVRTHVPERALRDVGTVVSRALNCVPLVRSGVAALIRLATAHPMCASITLDMEFMAEQLRLPTSDSVGNEDEGNERDVSAASYGMGSHDSKSHMPFEKERADRTGDDNPAQSGDNAAQGKRTSSRNDGSKDNDEQLGDEPTEVNALLLVGSFHVMSAVMQRVRCAVTFEWIETLVLGMSRLPQWSATVQHFDDAVWGAVLVCLQVCDEAREYLFDARARARLRRCIASEVRACVNAAKNGSTRAKRITQRATAKRASSVSPSGNRNDRDTCANHVNDCSQDLDVATNKKIDTGKQGKDDTEHVNTDKEDDESTHAVEPPAKVYVTRLLRLLAIARLLPGPYGDLLPTITTAMLRTTSVLPFSLLYRSAHHDVDSTGPAVLAIAESVLSFLDGALPAASSESDAHTPNSEAETSSSAVLLSRKEVVKSFMDYLLRLTQMSATVARALCSSSAAAAATVASTMPTTVNASTASTDCEGVASLSTRQDSAERRGVYLRYAPWLTQLYQNGVTIFSRAGVDGVLMLTAEAGRQLRDGWESAVETAYCNAARVRLTTVLQILVDVLRGSRCVRTGVTQLAVTALMQRLLRVSNNRKISSHGTMNGKSDDSESGSCMCDTDATSDSDGNAYVTLRAHLTHVLYAMDHVYNVTDLTTVKGSARALVAAAHATSNAKGKMCAAEAAPVLRALSVLLPRYAMPPTTKVVSSGSSCEQAALQLDAASAAAWIDAVYRLCARLLIAAALTAEEVAASEEWCGFLAEHTMRDILHPSAMAMAMMLLEYPAVRRRLCQNKQTSSAAADMDATGVVSEGDKDAISWTELYAAGLRRLMECGDPATVPLYISMYLAETTQALAADRTSEQDERIAST